MNQERVFQVLVGPHVSEKAAIVADENNQFVFKVMKDASKPEIKQAVELMFTVEVDSVRVSNVKGKQKRFKNTSGNRADWKKAYVKLKPGFDIDYMGA